MPTLECLDERSRAILQKLEEMDDRYSATHAEFRSSMQTVNKELTDRISKVEKDIAQMLLDDAHESGKKQGALWAGGIALAAFSAVFGAVGNVLYTWFIGPNGPLSR